MVNIKITKTKVGGIEKKINDFKTFLKDDLVKSAMAKSENRIQNKWQTDIPRIFNVRSSMGYQCDNILSKSLDIVQKGKNSIIIYVEPIIRYSKSTRSSGGAVNNLTTILFRGSASSFGKWSPKWDARVQVGKHPGTSPSTMRNYWKIFKQYATKDIRRTINEFVKGRWKRK